MMKVYQKMQHSMANLDSSINQSVVDQQVP